jgi:hypothetical protein
MFLTIMSHAQKQNTSPIYKNSRQLKHLVLNNTDHGYFGMETGMFFLPGDATAVTPGAQQYVGSDGRITPYIDYSFLETSKIYVGYAYKAHYFELCGGGIRGKIRLFKNTYPKFNDGDVTHYGTILIRYYYKLPIKSKRLKFLIGIETGLAYRFPIDYFIKGEKTVISPYPSSYPLVEMNMETKKANMVMGINARLDIKLNKNLTFTSQINFCGAFPNNSVYRLYDYPGDPSSNYTEYINSIMNLNISFGLKFDFYSKKKKQQTFEELKIGNPYTFGPNRENKDYYFK